MGLLEPRLWDRRTLVKAGLFVVAVSLLPIGALKYAVDKADGTLPPIETSALVVDRSDVILRPFPISDGRWRLPVTASDVDPSYLEMLLAYEDKRFFRHSGADPLAFVRAAWQAIGAGRAVSGGSTLTMQVARLLAGHNTRSADRKMAQILRALALERHQDKDDILDAYLNLAPFGGNLEGVRTASFAYFGKEPRRLSAAEAALLVALPQAPELRRPDRFSRRAKQARNRVLKRALDAGILDARAYERAVRTPVPDRRLDMPMLAPHLADEVRAARGKQPLYRLTIDAALQAKLEDLTRRNAGSLAHSTAIMVADIKSGEVRASVGSPDYFDRRGSGFVDMTRAVRSPGSTLKPLIYSLAFSDGIARPESLIEDRPISFSGYAPANFDRDYLGTVTVRDALQLSLNVPAVQLLDALGPVRLMQIMRKAGASPKLPANTSPNLAIGLGGVGMTLRDLVSLYGVIANGGRDIGLKTTFGAGEPQPRAVLDPRAAWMTASILAGTRDPNGLTGRGFAFKTGTTYGYRDAWAIGFDGRNVAGVWTGRPDGKPVPGLVGIDVAAPILADVFSRIGQTVPLPPPPPGVGRMRSADLPARLRHIGVAAAPDRKDTNAPELAYPPDKARIETAGSVSTTLHLKVRRGRLPLTYFINGKPISKGSFSRQTEWQPDTTGFVDIVVIDAKGAAARAKVFLQ